MGSRIRSRGRLSRRAWITALGLVLVLGAGAVGYAVFRPQPRPMVIGVHVAFPVVNVDAEDLPMFPLLANGNMWDPVIRRLVYSGLYRYAIVDGHRTPVADLAAGSMHLVRRPSCDPLRSSGRCFHDGISPDGRGRRVHLRATRQCWLPTARVLLCSRGPTR